ESFNERTKISLTASDCQIHILPLPNTVYSPCDKVQSQLTSRSLTYANIEGAPGAPPRLLINDQEIVGVDEAKLKSVLAGLQYPTSAKPSDVNFPMLTLLLFILVVYVTMVYGPIAAFLV